MKPVPFQYHAASSLAHAATLLADLGDEARVISGGQSLGAMLNLRMARPAHLVDISRIQDLQDFREDDEGTIWIGASVTHSAVEDSVFRSIAGDILRHVAGDIAYRSVRNRGTVCGSLAHADPAADWPPVLCALDARAHIVSAAGRRTVALREFYHGYFETAVKSGEILAAIEIPRLASSTRWAFQKEVLSHGGFASALALCIIPSDTEMNLWLGAAAPRPLDLSDIVQDMSLSRTSGPDEMTLVYEKIHAVIDLEDESDNARYRRHLHAVNARRALELALHA